MSHHPARDDSSGEIYNRDFWLVFVANLFLCTANTLTFRFAEFVKHLGGTEELTGSIVAAGLVASFFWRAFLGQAIDRFGVRNVWLFSTLFYLAGAWLLLTSDKIGWQIYVARASFVIGMASMFAAALSFVQGLAPPHRRTEIIGTYGASGFLGMIAGAQLGDLLFKLYPDSTTLFPVLFGLTMFMGAVHGFLAIFMTGGEVHVRPQVTPAAHQLFLRYWPPMVLIVTAMMGVVFAITTVFLTRYATQQGISGIRTFFSVYAITAFLMRVVARNWSQMAGRHRLIVYGLLAHAIALLALLPVSKDWHFIPAAICFGFGHALLFPCVVSLAAGAFPEQYRGTGTTITLTAIDLGTIISAPVLGWMIDNLGFRPMFLGTSLLLVISGGIYGLVSWQVSDSDLLPEAARKRLKRAPAREVSFPLSAESAAIQPFPVVPSTLKETVKSGATVVRAG
ncbi:MFS transporter [Planctomicrobium sp. SH661]|uniref:MFS transporter n=1 Tax=Planctomicrobium sp. SH661 TaxID=3448124 RepID=UPI003F5C75F7